MGVEGNVPGWRRDNLPRQLTSFVGRQQDLGDLHRVLVGDRLVTLTGAGGCGKTRLALELAGRSAGEFPDGTWWAELTHVVEERLVATAVAAALPLARGFGDQPMTDLVEQLRDRRALIVLDNCEHVASACARLVDTLLRGCPKLTILSTSRQPLDVDGEIVWRVRSLSVPPPELTDSGDTQPFEAVELFVERARRRRPGFVLDDRNAASVASICRRLDGLPLAIELAAASASSLTPQQIDVAVADHLLPLAAASPGRPPRQQTLDASIDWSHELLTAEERIVFRRLSVFAGSFSLDAARPVVEDGTIAGQTVLPILTRLVDRSLVHFEESLGGRYRLLETVRRYAGRAVQAAGEDEWVRHRHLDVCLSAAQRFARVAHGAEPSEFLDVLEHDRDDLLAAISWALASGRIDDARALSTDLLVFWMARYPMEGLMRLEAVLGGQGGDPSVRARAESAAAWLSLYGAFDAERSLHFARKAVEAGRRLGNSDLTATALNHLGWAAVYAAPDEAGPAFEEAVGVHERRADRPRLVHALAGLGFVALQEGDAARARALLERSLETARQAGDGIGIRRALAFLGAVLALHGDRDRAECVLTECLDRSRRLGDRYFIAHALDYLGLTALQAGHPDTARARLDEALLNARRSSPMALARSLVQSAYLAFATGDPAAAGGHLDAVREGAWGLNWYVARAGPLRAEIAVLDGDLDRAGAAIEDVVAEAGTQRPWARSLATIARARLLRQRGSLPQATAAAHDALSTLIRIGHRPDALDALELLVQISAAAGRKEEAARLFGAAGAARERFGLRRAAVYEPGMAATTAAFEATQGLDWVGLGEEGAAMSLEEALAYASRGRGGRRRPTAGWQSLTPAESQVAELVADGLSNVEIGGRLFISPATVRAHLGHIYTKLGVRSRAALVVEVRRCTSGAESS